MKNKLILRLSAVVLILVLVSSMLVNCMDLPDYSFSSSSTSKKTTTTTTTGSKIEDWENYPSEHKDVNNDGFCDDCEVDVVETVDFYNFNDLHGKFEDTDSQPGVDELTTFLKNAKETDDHTVFLSSGDMWQGGTASNGTGGLIITDWMNHLGFEAMALGNHEFDWGTDAIKENATAAEFPILAINIYDNSTGQRADFCDASVMIDRGGAQIGIIGAIGDCYSSISSEMTAGVNFKVGSELTALVKAESERLREAGADIIVYLLHDGASNNNASGTGEYYDQALSQGGYVDLVFEGHTHKYYDFYDDYGVPHLQGGGDNYKGITHVELDVNFANGSVEYKVTDCVEHYQCNGLADDPVVQELLGKYWDEIGWMYGTLGYNSAYRDDSEIEALVAELYYRAGVEKWGDEYDIVLAGGSINTRSPYNLYEGDVTYGDLQAILPFDNALYLCAIKGSDLKSRFYNNKDYVKYYTKGSWEIENDETYYIIADSWTALYYYAKCTTVEKYDDTTFARDLLAKYVQAGNWSE